MSKTVPPAPPASPVLAEKLMDAQTQVLGSLLLDQSLVGPVLSQVSDQDFTDAKLRAIYQTIRRLFSEGLPVEAAAINERLGRTCAQTLQQIWEVTPTATNCMAYVQLLKESALLYRFQALGGRMLTAADLEECRACADELNRMLCQRPGIRRTNLLDGYQAFLERHGAGVEPDYLPWGIDALDERVHAAPGDMVVLGGYSSDGKTALALQFAFRQAKTKRVGFFTFEDDNDGLIDRIVSSQTLVPMDRIKRNQMTEEDFTTVIDMQKPLTKPTLELFEGAGMTVADIQALSQSLHLDVIYVDYLQNVAPERGRRNQSAYERVTELSNSLQQMARRTGITLVALSQLNRPDKAKNGSTPAPTMSSLRQSGQIEQDAKIIMLLYREDASRRNGPRILKVEKNKEGQAGFALRLRFEGETQRFTRMETMEYRHRREEDPQQDLFKPVPEDKDAPF